MTVRLLHGDCLHLLRDLEADSIDALVTDPPYGLSAPPDIADVLRHWLDDRRYEHGAAGFMGRSWDSFVPGPAVWREALRVCKPGAHGVVFASDRTVDLMSMALRLAGWEIRHTGAWCYWSGFPKSLDVSKGIDALHGAEREPGQLKRRADGAVRANSDQWAAGMGYHGNAPRLDTLTAPATPDAARWSGWGTALKPAHEPWILVRKPLSESSIARNVLRWGTGAIHIDACRFAPGDPMWVGPNEGTTSNHGESGVLGTSYALGARDPMQTPGQELGRYPANLIHAPKASTAERELGCDGLPKFTGAQITGREEEAMPDGARRRALGLDNPRAGAGRTSTGRANVHPTVKPLAVMRWLVRLVTPLGGVVLDPFTGSGTTGMAAVGQGFGFVGCELEPTPERVGLDREIHHHIRIAAARIRHAAAGRKVEVSAAADEGVEPPEQVALW